MSTNFSKFRSGNCTHMMVTNSCWGNFLGISEEESSWRRLTSTIGHCKSLCWWRFIIVRLIHHLQSGGFQAVTELVTTELEKLVQRRFDTMPHQYSLHPKTRQPFCRIVTSLFIKMDIIRCQVSTGLNFRGTKLSRMAVEPQKPQKFSTVKIKVHKVYASLALTRIHLFDACVVGN